MDFESNINNLATLLKSIIISESNDELSGSKPLMLYNEIEKIKSTDVGGDLEIVFRKVVDFIHLENTCSNHEKNTLYIKLLDFSMSFCTRYLQQVSSIRRLPFMVLEDIIDGRTVENAEIIWDYVEALPLKIDSDFFDKGKFPILRTCNGLLRRLSKSCNTEFCGKVLMFLAAVYPISERSSVNVNGKVNTGNVTSFLSQDEYQAAVAAATTEITETLDFGSDHSNQKKVVAPANEEGEEVEEEENTADKLISPTTVVSEPNSNYDLYKTFWNLQSFLNTDLKKMDQDFGLTAPASVKATNLSSVNAPIASDATRARTDEWQSFIRHVETILDLFEKKGFHASELEQSRIKERKIISECLRGHRRAREYLQSQLQRYQADCTDTNSSARFLEVSPTTDRKEEEYMGCKYLTSPSLFELQLRDPILRQELLVQLLIFLHNLSRRLRITIENAAAAAQTATSVMVSTVRIKGKGTPVPAPAHTTAENGANGKGLKIAPSSGTIPSAPISSASNSNTATLTPTSTAPLTPLESLVQIIRLDIHRLRERILSVLRVTPPDGEGLTLSVLMQLERETRWIAWKQRSCLAFERPSVDLATLFDLTQDKNIDDDIIPTLGMKRKVESSDSLSGGPSKKGGLVGLLTKSIGGNGGRSALTTGTAVLSGSSQYVCDLALETVTKSAVQIVDSVPTFEKHLQLFAEAEDPDNGIEDEYHPRHDEVYCWRARRLMCERRFSLFESMPDGDIGKGLRAFAGVVQPIAQLSVAPTETAPSSTNEAYPSTSRIDANNRSKPQFQAHEAGETLTKTNVRFESEADAAEVSVVEDTDAELTSIAVARDTVDVVETELLAVANLSVSSNGAVPDKSTADSVRLDFSLNVEEGEEGEEKD